MGLRNETQQRQQKQQRQQGQQPWFLAVADSSASLPDPLRTLAKSNDAFADSMAKLDDETEAVANYAERVHKVALNDAERANILDTISSELKQGMPDASAYNEAETNALNAAATYKTSPSAAKKAALQAAVAKAEDASNALVEATRAHVRQVLKDEHVDELMGKARMHEAKAKKALREAKTKGSEAAHEEYAFGKMGQQRAEEARALSEKWAEDHEQAIEDASDRSNDDLERIYGPVKELARHLVEVAERNDAMHRLKLQKAQGFLESGERVELVQALRGEVE